MCSKCKLHSSVWRRVCWLRQQSHPHWQCGCVYLCVLLWAIGFPICCQPILYCDCQASTCGPDGPQHPFLCFMVHDNTMFRVDVVVNNNTHFYVCWYPCVFSPRICAQCVRLFVRCYRCRGGWGGAFFPHVEDDSCDNTCTQNSIQFFHPPTSTHNSMYPTSVIAVSEMSFFFKTMILRQ